MVGNRGKRIEGKNSEGPGSCQVILRIQGSKVSPGFDSVGEKGGYPMIGYSLVS